MTATREPRVEQATRIEFLLPCTRRCVWARADTKPTISFFRTSGCVPDFVPS